MISASRIFVAACCFILAAGQLRAQSDADTIYAGGLVTYAHELEAQNLLDSSIAVMLKATAAYDTWLTQNPDTVTVKKLINAHLDLAHLYWKNADPSKRTAVLRQAHQTTQLLPENHLLRPDILLHMARNHYMTGQHDSTKLRVQDALRLQHKHYGENAPFAAGCYNLLGVVYMAQGEFTQSRNHFQKRLNIVTGRYGPNHRQAVGANFNLGLLYQKFSLHDKAIQYFLTALHSHEKSRDKDPAFSASIHVNVGSGYYELADYENALHHYHKALAIQKEIFSATHGNLALSHSALSRTYNALGQKDRAFAHADTTLEIALQLNAPGHPRRTRAWLSLARLYQGVDSAAKAEFHFQQALLSADPALADNTDPAAFDWHQTIHHYTLLDVLTAEADFLLNRTDRLHSRIENLTHAQLRYAQATQLTTLMRQGLDKAESKQFLVTRVGPIYEKAIATCHLLAEATGDQQQLQRAFELAENGKAILLAESLQDSQAKRFAGIPDELLDRESRLAQQLAGTEEAWRTEKQKGDRQNKTILASLEDSIFALNRAQDSLQRHLEQRYPDYFELRYSFKPTNIAALQQAMPAGTVMLEYFAGDDQLFVFAVSNQHRAFHVVPTSTGINDSLRQFVQSLTDRSLAMERGRAASTRQQFARQSHFVYQQLVAPVLTAEHGPNNKLVVVPDGLLSYVPFELLVTEQPAEPTAYGKLSLLIKSHSIRYNYSASLLLEHTEPHGNATEFFAGFAPTYGTGNALAHAGTRSATTRAELTPLANNQPEVEAISAIVDGNAFLASDASENAFKTAAANYQVLHFAMHALVNDTAPLYSNLVFTEPADTLGDDGYLKVWEIYNLPLQADLVVLSACNTGIGKMVRGEGLMSLARAFRYAGCPNVVTSLWQAEDASTKAIMERFYRHIEAGVPKDEALQLARLEYLETHPNDHPFFWGAFVLIGDDRPVGNNTTSGPWLWLLLGGLTLGAGAMLVRNRKRRQSA